MTGQDAWRPKMWSVMKYPGGKKCPSLVKQWQPDKNNWRKQPRILNRNLHLAVLQFSIHMACIHQGAAQSEFGRLWFWMYSTTTLQLIFLPTISATTHIFALQECAPLFCMAITQTTRWESYVAESTGHTRGTSHHWTGGCKVIVWNEAEPYADERHQCLRHL